MTKFKNGQEVFMAHDLDLRRTGGPLIPKNTKVTILKHRKGTPVAYWVEVHGFGQRELHHVNLSDSVQRLIHKITHGYVIQNYDLESGKFVSQEFVAGDCEYEKASGTPLSSGDDAEIDAKFFDKPDGEPYLCFDMVQPK